MKNALSYLCGQLNNMHFDVEFSDCFSKPGISASSLCHRIIGKAKYLAPSATKLAFKQEQLKQVCSDFVCLSTMKISDVCICLNNDSIFQVYPIRP